MMRTSRFLLLLAAAALAACAGQNQAVEHQQPVAKAAPALVAEPIPTGRLPADVKPTAYHLDFVMDPDQPGYSGKETINIELAKPRNTIWFHGKGIDVSSAELVLADGKSLNAKYEQVNDDGVAKLTLPETVTPQQARIVINFDRKQYSSGLAGAYKVKADGINYIFTQFEAIDARQAFPSFDEPAFKTPYTYSFTVPNGDKVVANTPVQDKTDAGNGMTKWQFMTTRPLPTYLVAWAIGPLDIVTGKPVPANSLHDYPIPVYGVTVKGKGDQIRYAADHAGEIVAAEEKYFGIAYPWRKLSIIAVPDFQAGAMENVGAITFRDNLLLMDPKTAPTWQKRAFWSVAAHEIGHMWTGDLVTVPWWNDIWLNEAFATWTAQRTMETLHPEWHPAMDGFRATEGAMHSDSLVTARAIRQPIKSTGDILNAFDGITYEKGSAVIHMFEEYLGPEKFRKGMHDYLEHYSYGSADLDGFLSAISTSTGQDIGPAFKTFLNQPGLPLVEASMRMQDGKPIVHLTQSRYLPLGSSGDPHGTQWQIPVCMHYPVNGKVVEQCHLLTSESADVPLQGKTLPAWLMPNANGQGYYQWSLDKAGYAALIKSYNKLNPVEELSMAASVGAAFDAGKIDTVQAMQALAPLAHSKHEDVAEVPMGIISYARTWLVSGKTKKGVEAYARKLYSGYHVARDFTKGGAPKDANKREFEASVAGFLAYTGQDHAVKRAADAAALRILGINSHGKVVSKPDFNAVAPEFVSVALDTGVRNMGAPVFDAAYANFKDASSPLVRNTMFGAMLSATDPALVQRLRDMLFEPGALRQNEMASVLYSQFFKPETRNDTWQWFQANYGRVIKVLPNEMIYRMPALARAFCSDTKAAEVKDFFKDKMDHPGSHRALAEAMESAHLCATQRATQSASAEKFFSRY